MTRRAGGHRLHNVIESKRSGVMISKSDIPEYAPAEIELPNGWTAAIRTEPDEDARPPWKESDDYGPVSDWRPIASKQAGERALCEDRGQALFYDFAEAVRIARRGGWGCPHYPNGGGKGAQAACAAEADFERLRAWCSNQWYWIGVIVTVLDAEREEVDKNSVWGIESDTDRWREVAAELVNEIAGGVVLPNGAAVRS